jgi:hypothetical protein
LWFVKTLSKPARTWCVSLLGRYFTRCYSKRRVRLATKKITSGWIGTEHGERVAPVDEGQVFRMFKKPKRDVFEFSDGRQISLGDLPAGLIFDVLVVPGSEELSTLLDMEPAVQHEDEEKEKEPLLIRLLTRF